VEPELPPEPFATVGCSNSKSRKSDPASQKAPVEAQVPKEPRPMARGVSAPDRTTSAAPKSAGADAPEVLKKPGEIPTVSPSASAPREESKPAVSRSVDQKAEAEKSSAAAAKASSPAAELTVSVATDSAEISKLDVMKISFKNLSVLQELEKKAGGVLYAGQVLQEEAALIKLKNGNEESFCAVRGAHQFNPQDFLKIADGESHVLDEGESIYQTTLVFENSNGKLQFICTHVTGNYYVEELRLNFKDLITLQGFDGKTENEANYINPRTEDRHLQAVQIQDIEKLKKTIVKQGARENFALVRGEIQALEAAVNSVRSEKEVMACFVHEVLGKLEAGKTYVQVERGIGEDTPSRIPTAGIYHIYLADADNGFVLYCIQSKRAPLRELFVAFKDVFKFGVLERKEYRTKRAELIRIHKERTESPPAK
jgi:hypothetical protein